MQWLLSLFTKAKQGTVTLLVALGAVLLYRRERRKRMDAEIERGRAETRGNELKKVLDDAKEANAVRDNTRRLDDTGIDNRMRRNQWFRDRG